MMQKFASRISIAIQIEKVFFWKTIKKAVESLGKSTSTHPVG